MKEFNMNYPVKVQLTELGFAMHKQFFTQLHNLDSNYQYTPPVVDEQGYSEFKLGELMHYFGSCPDLVIGFDLPFKPTIQINEEHLNDVDRPMSR